MDFQRTIKTAVQKCTENNQNQIKYYSTKFEPPKKIERTKKLSANIQKFLARKEEEERQKATEAREKRDKLLELRAQDKKATRRVNVMLKRTKSANQSAIEDAVGNQTSITMAGGLSQPDEDDYGYVSQSAADFYNKMMEKYNNMPDERKWDFTKKKTNGSLSSTKDRVRNALNQEEADANQPHRRKRKNHDTFDEPVFEEKYKKEEKVKPKVKAAPVVNFNDLLKIAEKKQFEPIKVEVKKDEEVRPLTKKQKREQEKDRELREQREKRERDRAAGIVPPPTAPGRIPKLNSTTDTKGSSSSSNSKPSESSSASSAHANNKKPINSPNTSNSIKRDGYTTSNGSNNNTKGKLPPQKCDISNKRSELPKSTPNGHNTSMIRKDSQPRPPSKPTTSNCVASAKSRDISSQQSRDSRDIRPKEFPPRDPKPKQFPPRDMKPRQFPPPDVRRNGGPPPKRKAMPVKGRIYDDSDEEYDSEMDDFIDDGPEEEEDYSKHIREMFGYDKRKYHYRDEDDDNMESTFAQQMREEVISTKIGIMEDLEEQRKEDEHIRRKALMKKSR